MENEYHNKKMIGRKNKFSQKLFDKYDIPARKKLIGKLEGLLEENQDQYGADLLIKSEDCKYRYLEVQVCATWINDYPFDKMFIYERKGRYKNDTLFITLDKNMTKGYIFDTEGIEKVEPRRLKKYSREFVYDIPWSRCMFVTLEYLDKETIELY